MIRTGIIGYGLSGRAFHAPLIEFVEGLQLAAIASSRQEEIHQRYPEVQVCSAEELLASNSIDLVVITSPNNTHFDLAKQALNQGKHVVLEKPMVMSVEQGEQLITLAEQNNQILSVYHNRRWDSDSLTVKSLLQDNRLGSLHTFKAHFHNYKPTVRAKWKQSNDNGGTLYDLGAHLVDEALNLFGWPQQVSSDVRTRHLDHQVNDYFAIRLYYPGLIAELNCDMLTAYAGPRYELHGDKGSYLKSGIDVQEQQLVDGLTPADAGYGIDPDMGELFFPGNPQPEQINNLPGCYFRYYEQVVSAINNQTPAPVSAEQGLDVIRLLALCERYSGKGIVDISRD